MLWYVSLQHFLGRTHYFCYSSRVSRYTSPNVNKDVNIYSTGGIMGATGSIVATISAVKHTVDLVNIIRESAKSLKDAENDLKLAELLGSLAKVKTNVAEIENQLTEKDSEIRELKAKLKLQSEVDWQDPSKTTGAKGRRPGTRHHRSKATRAKKEKYSLGPAACKGLQHRC